MKKILIILLTFISVVGFSQQNPTYVSVRLKDSTTLKLSKDSTKFETSKLFFAFNKPIYVQGHLIGSGAAIHDSLTANSQHFIKYTGITANSPIFFSQSTGVISAQQASTSQAGVLSASDWNTFNNKSSTHYADSVAAQAAHDTISTYVLDSAKLVTSYGLQDGLSSNVSINTPAFAIDGISGSNLSMRDDFSTLSVINKLGGEFGINADTTSGVRIYSDYGIIKINDTDTAATQAYSRAHGGGITSIDTTKTSELGHYGTQYDLSLKVDKVTGKGLSTIDSLKNGILTYNLSTKAYTAYGNPPTSTYPCLYTYADHPEGTSMLTWNGFVRAVNFISDSTSGTTPLYLSSKSTNTNNLITATRGGNTKFYVDKDGEAYANGVHLGGGGSVTTTAPLQGTTSLTIDTANSTRPGSYTKYQYNKNNSEDTLYISSADILAGINDTLVSTNSGATQTIYTTCLISYRHVSTAYTGGTTDTIAVFGKYKGVKKKLLYISSSYITDAYSGRGQFPLAWDKLDPGSPIWVHIPSFSTGNGILRMRFIKKQETW